MDNAKHTPGPWFLGAMNDCLFVLDKPPSVAGADVAPHMRANGPAVIAKLDYWKADANARLIATAPDHAMIGWAMCVGAAQWIPWGDMRGEFRMNGIRHATKLDEFGVPEMTDAMRAAIAKAKGTNP